VFALVISDDLGYAAKRYDVFRLPKVAGRRVLQYPNDVGADDAAASHSFLGALFGIIRGSAKHSLTWHKVAASPTRVRLEDDPLSSCHVIASITDCVWRVRPLADGTEKFLLGETLGTPSPRRARILRPKPQHSLHDGAPILNEIGLSVPRFERSNLPLRESRPLAPLEKGSSYGARGFATRTM
jgi:hypothetical protein